MIERERDGEGEERKKRNIHVLLVLHSANVSVNNISC